MVQGTPVPCSPWAAAHSFTTLCVHVTQSGIEAVLPKMSMNPFCEIALEVGDIGRAVHIMLAASASFQRGCGQHPTEKSHRIVCHTLAHLTACLHRPGPCRRRSA